MQMKKFLKFTAYILAVFLVLAILTVTLISAFLSNVNLDLNKLKRRESAVTVCYADGSPMRLSCNESYVDGESIPKHVKDALVAIEDKRFYKHKGIDVKSVFRALGNNVFTKNSKQGGSTITQQLVKNTYLSGEKTLSRKIKEMKLAIELEKKLDKQSILECYLNTVYFGEGAYGIASASKRFFNKSAKDLTVEEGATLIACLKAPSIYSPYKNIQKSTDRRNLILKEMYSQGYINEKQYKTAKNTEIILKFESNYETENILYDEILKQCCELIKVYEPSSLNGFKIYTSIEKDFDKKLINFCNYGLDCDVSVIVSDNREGRIIGYYSTVGNIKRCPASTAKPWLVYAPAIEEDLICPATKILDEKTSFDGYTPSNYNDKYYGYVSVKDCLVKSLNVPSVKICNMLGSKKTRYYAENLGIEYTNDDLSVALGNLSGGISLQNLVDAYSVFSNGGYFKSSSFIDKIENSKGKSVYKNISVNKKVFSDSTVFLINDALSACSKYGTADKLKGFDFEVCAKTGTNGNENGNLDAYCIAYTSSHTVAVWIGKADGSYMDNSITGGNYPTQIVKGVLGCLYESSAPKDFEPPSSVKSVFIDKDFYDKDCKIYLSDGNEKDGVKFWFKSDFKIENLPKKQIEPIIKSYKITCNYCDIQIDCEIDKDVLYKIYDSDGNELFDSKNGGKFNYTAPKNGEYSFILQPYVLRENEIVLGEKIKLPSVLVEGKSNILDSEWWED